MDRDEIIAKLREYASELKAAGVQHLFLHGSYARGTAIRGSSDIDIIAEFEPGRGLTLGKMFGIKNGLTKWRGVRVNLSPPKKWKKIFGKKPEARPELPSHRPSPFSTLPTQAI